MSVAYGNRRADDEREGDRGEAVRRIYQDGYARQGRKQLLEQLQSFPFRVGGLPGEPGDVASWMSQIADETGGDRVARLHHDWNGLGCSFGGDRRGCSQGDDHLDRQGTQFGSEAGVSLRLAGCEAVDDLEILPLDVTQIAQTLL